MASFSAKIVQFVNSEAGPKTVHFWAPVMKWSLVIAGAKDFTRPVEKLSANQQVALMATGFIWTRWCFVIRPRNYLLASVNFFLGVVATVQLGRLYNYQRALGYTPTQSLKQIFASKKDPAKAKAEAKAAGVV